MTTLDPPFGTDADKSALKPKGAKYKSIYWQDASLKLKTAFFIASILEILSFLNQTGLAINSIPVFRQIEVPIISQIWPDLHVSDILAVTMAFLIITIPAIIIHVMLNNGLLEDPKSFWRDKYKRYGLFVSIVIAYLILRIEIFNFVAAEEYLIGEVKRCVASNPFCDPKAVAEKIRIAEQKIKNAETYAYFFTAMNVCLGGLWALVFHQISVEQINKEKS